MFFGNFLWCASPSEEHDVRGADDAVPSLYGKGDGADVAFRPADRPSVAALVEVFEQGIKVAGHRAAERGLADLQNHFAFVCGGAGQDGPAERAAEHGAAAPDHVAMHRKTAESVSCFLNQHGAAVKGSVVAGPLHFEQHFAEFDASEPENLVGFDEAVGKAAYIAQQVESVFRWAAADKALTDKRMQHAVNSGAVDARGLGKLRRAGAAEIVKLE